LLNLIIPLRFAPGRCIINPASLCLRDRSTFQFRYATLSELEFHEKKPRIWKNLCQMGEPLYNESLWVMIS